ncbi:sensor domain-containing diguanylate cyclase [Spirochaeta isovalerica]|uniref:diguanylate cyclase n=1 Tax=Spirochaeta isovalerica TaxID=150 RepID=A0A841RD60_9SPIO|nr:sensor domain-containing diguanylate cyclase [Spirochaeta isovalerica]MBB6481586.1 diguanylate cyclase (GGDEF)-like protein/PAS domain S-box-containing protein [Spirochaeta isovalerica]
MKDSLKLFIANLSLLIIFAAAGLCFFPGLEVPVYLLVSAVIIAGGLINGRLLQKRNGEGRRYVSDLSETLMRQSPQGIFIIDRDGFIVDLNLKGESWFYDAREDICGKSLFRNVDCSLTGNRRFKTIFFNDMGTHFPAEVHVRRLDGERRNHYAVFIEDLTEIVREQDKLLRMANEDALTGLLNRRSFLLELKKEIDRSNRTGLDCTLVLIDLDHFKNINDTYGHDFGDEVLRVFSAVLRENCRSLDIICRYGGEEFVVLLPHTKPGSALNYLERVRTDFASYPYSRNIRPTFSCGVTGGKLKGAEGEVDRLLKEADTLLYRAKEKGRDRIEVPENSSSEKIRVVS